MPFLIEQFPYVLLMVLSAGLLIWPTVAEMITGGNELSTHEATVLMNQRHAIILDIRKAEDFGKAHIPGAKHYPLTELKNRAAELTKFQSRPVIVVGEGAGRAMALLKANGFKELGQLQGGMRAWLEAGLPSEKTPA